MRLNFIGEWYLSPDAKIWVYTEVSLLFGEGSRSKLHLALRIRRVHEIADSTGRLARFVVFGSFVARKSEPNDVDIFMIMDDEFDVGAVTGDAKLLFDHSVAQSHFGCSVFWVRRL